MNKKIKYLLLIILLVTIISTVSYCSAPYDTETANIITVRKTINASGYILREETVVRTSYSGIFEPSVKNGTRLSAGSTVGILTSGNFDRSLTRKLEDVTNRINEIKLSEDIADIYSSDEARIFSAMRNLSGNIRENVIKGKLEDASETVSNLDALVKKKHSVESQGAADQLLVSLEEEKFSLEKKLGGVREEVVAPVAGCYYKALDGMEGAGSEENISLLTTDSFVEFEKTLSEYKKEPSQSGKIVNTFYWYAAFTAPKEECENLKTGDNVTISVDDSAFVDAKVFYLNTEDENNTVVVVKSSKNISGIFEKRSGEFEICTSEHTGLYVPRAAIRIKDGITGVYVMNKTDSISFRCINILLEENDYYIAQTKYIPPQGTQYKALAIYDNILVNPEVADIDSKSSKKS